MMIYSLSMDRGRWRWVLLAALLAALAMWALWPTATLEIRTGEGGPLVKSIPVETGERITYSYLHSVQKSRIDEVMEVAAGDRLVVQETVYDMFGAGLPSDVPGGTLTFDPDNGKFRITGMSRDLAAFRVRVGFIAEQTLEVRGVKIRLDSMAPPTTLLVISVAGRPRIAGMLPPPT